MFYVIMIFAEVATLNINTHKIITKTHIHHKYQQWESERKKMDKKKEWPKHWNAENICQKSEDKRVWHSNRKITWQLALNHKYVCVMCTPALRQKCWSFFLSSFSFIYLFIFSLFANMLQSNDSWASVEREREKKYHEKRNS